MQLIICFHLFQLNGKCLFMDILNKIFKNKLGYEFKVIEFVSKDTKNSYYKVKFINSGFETVTTRSNIKRQTIKDPYQPSVANIGYLGELYRLATTKNKYYSVWHNMINRCYNPKSTEYKRYGQAGVTVCERWHNFTNFYNDVKKLDGFDEQLFLSGKISLDKDIKQKHLPKCQRVYSPETCMFVTIQENSLNADYTDRINKVSLRFKAISPEGEIIIAQNATQFEKEHNLSAGTISRCLSGKIKQSKGWKFENI